MLVSSRWMAAVSDVLPSPGAPVTDGTIAITGPSRPMLPVVVAGSAGAAATGAAALSAGAAWPRPGAWRVPRPGLLLAPLPAGRRRSRAAQRRQRAVRPGSAARRRTSWRPCRRSTAPPAGVSAAHGSLLAVAAAASSPVMRFTRLPVGIGDVPDVGDLGAALVLGGDDVAAQRVVGLLVLAGDDRDALAFEIALVNS